MDWRRKIRGKDIIFLSAGTDGTDGPTNDAGGIVDGETEDKGFLLGLDIDTFLNNADAGSYLNSTDSLVTTGPTGTNVMDLIIALKNWLNFFKLYWVFITRNITGVIVPIAQDVSS